MSSRTSDLVSETVCRRAATCVSRNATFAFRASSSDSFVSMINSDCNGNRRLSNKQGHSRL